MTVLLLNSHQLSRLMFLCLVMHMLYQRQISWVQMYNKRRTNVPRLKGLNV